MRIVVVGAGFIGVNLANSLLAEGHEVILAGPEPQEPEASAVSFGWLNSHRKRPDVYQALNYRALDYWRDVFAQRFPTSVQWGGHTIAVSDQENVDLLIKRVRYLQKQNYPAELITSNHNEVSAALPLDWSSTTVAHFPVEGYCDQKQIRLDLLEDSQSLDAFTRVHLNVVEVKDTGVLLETGEFVSSDRIVIAAGNGTTDLAQKLGHNLPIVPQDWPGPAWGYLAVLDLQNHGLTQVVSTDKLNLRPIGPHRLLLQAFELDAHLTSEGENRRWLEKEFLRRASLLFGRDDATLVRIEIGHRVIPIDGQTVAGPLSGPASDPIWCVMSHSGITLGPWLARTIAREITLNELGDELQSFRPNRFEGSTPTHIVSVPIRPGEQ